MPTYSQDILKVSSQTDPNKLAGALFAQLKTGEVKATGIGPHAVNNLVKAVIIARGWAATQGFDIAIVPSFTTVVGDDAHENSETTAITHRIFKFSS